MAVVRSQRVTDDAVVLLQNIGITGAEPLANAVEASMSVKRNVSVPVGRSVKWADASTELVALNGSRSTQSSS